jgi:hypothetical protein
MLSLEAANTNIIVFGLTWQGIQQTFYRLMASDHVNYRTLTEYSQYVEIKLINLIGNRQDWLYRLVY